jgi:hypothetical protein
MEGVDFAHDVQLPSRVVSHPLVVEFVGLPHRSGVEHVGARKPELAPMPDAEQKSKEDEDDD